MIQIADKAGDSYLVTFSKEKGMVAKDAGIQVGLEHPIEDRIYIKDAAARAVKAVKERKKTSCTMDISVFTKTFGVECISDIAEGILLGLYEQEKFPAVKKNDIRVQLTGLNDNEINDAQCILQQTIPVIEGVMFARDMVNRPGNKLRPLDFAEEIINQTKGTKIEAQLLQADELEQLHMDALLGVGKSSAYPPCMLVLRYMQGEPDAPVTGLIGKGVTVDTGGYCLKPASSMAGIKGDMAGGAAVAAAICALAKNEVKTNAVAVIPMCENRISPGSLLPGDVISSYAGKSIEIGNTDAEGRLLLADAVAYAVDQLGVTRVLDIATLTGAVVAMLGFSIGGVISDNQKFFDDFRGAWQRAGERYWRLPFYPEHEKMIESKIADIKNMGEKHCGTITAGLFIRTFAKGIPWLHLDIAGTAWVDAPIFGFQSKGATGAGVTSLYHLCCRKDK